MADEVSHRLQRLKWSVTDAAIAAKERLPSRLYRQPPESFGYLLILPGILLVGFLFVGTLLLARYSVLTFDPIEFVVNDYTLENWRRFLDTPAYHRIFFRTVWMAAAITVLSVLSAFPYAYLTIRVDSSLLRKLLLIGIFVPFFTGIIVRAYGWLILLGRNGIVNTALEAVGIGSITFIGTNIGVVIGLLQIMIPYSIVMLAPAIQAIDPAMERAAMNLGANRVDTFRHVVVPLAKPGIAGASIVVFTITAATFAIPDLIGSGQVDFMANLIFSALFSQVNYPLAAVLSLTLVLVASLIVMGIFYRVGTGTLGIETGAEHE
jgi:putative spermidine/putrescine transport system permease protein